jgi:hypothetical protein
MSSCTSISSYMVLRSGKNVYYQCNKKNNTKSETSIVTNTKLKKNRHPIVLVLYMIVLIFYAAVSFEILKYKLLSNGI